MLKTILASAALAFTFAAPSFAEDMKACDEATMKMVMEMVDKADGEAKTMAMKEFDMAKESMKMNKAEDCSMHLGMAEKAAMKK